MCLQLNNVVQLKLKSYTFDFEKKTYIISKDNEKKLVSLTILNKLFIFSQEKNSTHLFVCYQQMDVARHLLFKNHEVGFEKLKNMNTSS